MAYNYIYIDDEDAINGIIAGLDNENISISYHKPKVAWNDEMSFFEKEHSNIDGLILDLRLEDGINGIEFKGSTLAQEIRTRQKERKIRSFPIVLFSANSKLEESLDKTAKDLFDLIQEKGKLDNTDAIINFRNHLLSLSEGYELLCETEAKSIENILGISSGDIRDSRFIATFNEQLGLPVHNIAKFVLTEMLNREGLLISEKVLAARLGIDIEKSADWKEFLKRVMLSLKYTGVFSDYWTRWWMPLLEKWWNEISPNDYFRSLSAEIRTRIIKETTGLERLFPIEKADKSNSDTFWTVCKGTGVPIDTTDGLILPNQDNLYPWQDKEYVSVFEALEESNKSAWGKVASSEKARLEKLKNIFGNAVRIRK